jgi:hypothetical protein
MAYSLAVSLELTRRLSVEAVKNLQRQARVALRRHGAETGFSVKTGQRLRAEFYHQFVDAQAAAFDQGLEAVGHVVRQSDGEGAHG